MDRLEHSEEALGEDAACSVPVVVPRRLVGLMVAGPCWAALLVGMHLAPSKSGMGTHEQLGIPPCSFLVKTGWPCPSCGLTTSLAAMAHGRVLEAWQAHPFGVMLFYMVVVAAVLGTVQLVTGKAVLKKLRPGVWWVWAAMVGMFAGWGYKALVGYLNGSYPIG